MRNLVCGLALAFLLVAAMTAQPAQQQNGPDLSWAFLVPDTDQPAVKDDGKPIRLPGSDKTYTMTQIDDLYNPPDWFPNEHAPMPKVVQQGDGKNLRACAACHLASGLGHPESADLAGLPAAYFTRQMAAFKSNQRKNGGLMQVIAKATTEEDARLASEWFASLKPIVWVKVVEADTVPKSFVNLGRMRLPRAGGATEPLGDRIIELPQDVERTLWRDPHSGTVAYVPAGSIAKGEALVKTGGAGKTIPCAVCHGESLMGLAEAPRIAGLSPLYITRQLYNFRAGTTPGSWGELMKAPVARLDYDDILDISAYVASLNVGGESANETIASPSAAVVPTAATLQTPASGSMVVKGKAVFSAYRCYDCHGMNGEGTDDGPDLIGTLLTGDQISSFLQKPDADASAKGMPNIPATSPDSQALVAYILSIKRAK